MNQYNLDISKVVHIGTELFQIADPTDGAGRELPQFSLYKVYSVERSEIEVICQKLYKQVSEKINAGSLGDSKALLINYVDMRVRDKRTYIVVTRETRRNTKATIFMRFHGYGDHLYIGIDAYVLGKIKWSSVLWRLLLCLAGFIVLPLATAISTFLTASSYSSNPSGTSNVSVWWIAFVIFLVTCWSEVIKNVIHNPKKPLSLAFRQAFPGSVNLGSFNVDDMMMFLKSTLSIGVLAVRDVLQEEGFPVETLDAFVQNINFNNVFQGTVGAVAGNVQGNFIANSQSQER